MKKLINYIFHECEKIHTMNIYIYSSSGTPVDIQIWRKFSIIQSNFHLCIYNFGFQLSKIFREEEPHRNMVIKSNRRHIRVIQQQDADVKKQGNDWN